MVELLILIVAFVVVISQGRRLTRLERTVAELSRRVAADPSAQQQGAPATVPPAPVPPASAATAAVPTTPAEVTSEPAVPMAADAVASGSGAAPTGSPSPTTPPPPPPPFAKPRRGFEEKFGTRWVVWIGGLAIALGGIFLVQYSIEQGLLGPGVRIVLGGILAALLIAGGEWTRRLDLKAGFAGMPGAHVPGILTAAGTIVAFAVVYAAYALYGYIDSTVAFLLLGAIAIATLAAALLHGPALAGVGMVGAFAVPLLVSSGSPSYWALTLYLAVVTAAAFALAAARRWRWLALAAMLIGAAWILPGIDDPAAMTAHAAHALMGLALAAIFIVAGLLFGPDAEDGAVDGVSSLAVAAYVLAAALLVIAQEHDGGALAAFAAAVAATLLIAWRADSAAAAVPGAGALLLVVMADWAIGHRVVTLLGSFPVLDLVPRGPPVDFGDPHVLAAAGLGALFALAGFFAQGRSGRAAAPICWAASAVFVPIALLLIFYYRIAALQQSYIFAAIALVLAALATVATERLSRQAAKPGTQIAGALFATGAVASLALALTFALEKGWLTVGFALMVPGIAWVAVQRPLPVLRLLAAAIAGLVVLRTAWDPRIAGIEIGTTPIFNWLLWGYGVPASAFAVAGVLLRRRADDAPARAVDAAAILFTVLLVFLEIRHFVHAGDIYRRAVGLVEAALQVSAWLALAIGLERLYSRSRNPVHNAAALILAGIALAGSLALAVPLNPWLNRVPVGGAFINLLTLGYLLPAILIAVLGYLARATRPAWYRAIAAVAAVVMMLLYLSLTVTRLYHGPIVAHPNIGDAEQYTYSAVWLAFGVVLLVVGIYVRSQPVRLASAAVTLATVAKVFLIDLGGLTGVFRALSFLGLGLVLVAIGWLYQRLLFPHRVPPATELPGTGPPNPA